MIAEARALPPFAMSRPIPARRSAIKSTFSMPSQWLGMYDDFITKNAHQVSQIESTLRSLTYIIPGTRLRACALPPQRRAGMC
jgi:hypothetical protein